MRSFKTAVAHYPSTSVATHTATRRRAHKGRHETTHLLCLTKNNDDAPPLRHDESTHLHCVTKRRTSAASRRTTTHLRCVTKKRTDAPPLRHEDHEDHEETIVSNEGAIVTDDVGRNGVPHLDGTARRRTSVASRKHETKRRTSVASRNEAYERTNETAFAPPLQRHEHEPQDRNERHEQRRRPLN